MLNNINVTIHKCLSECAKIDNQKPLQMAICKGFYIYQNINLSKLAQARRYSSRNERSGSERLG